MNRQQLDYSPIGPDARPLARLHWMKFAGDDFWALIDGQSNAVGLAALRLIWNYWKRECAGLPNNPDTLKGIARLDDIEWERAKTFLLGEVFWQDEDMLWHRNAVRDEFAEARHISLIRQASGGKGGRPPGGRPPPRKAIG
jgi:hypothetical protein